MKSNTKSSITLPPSELELVNSLKKRLHAKSKVEVIRKGLQLLKESTDRQALRNAYKKASEATRGTLQDELDELDALSGEGLD